jgi:hypothetical protein
MQKKRDVLLSFMFFLCMAFLIGVETSTASDDFTLLAKKSENLILQRKEADAIPILEQMHSLKPDVCHSTISASFSFLLYLLYFIVRSLSWKYTAFYFQFLGAGVLTVTYMCVMKKEVTIRNSEAKKVLKCTVKMRISGSRIS